MTLFYNLNVPHLRRSDAQVAATMALHRDSGQFDVMALNCQVQVSAGAPLAASALACIAALDATLMDSAAGAQRVMRFAAPAKSVLRRLTLVLSDLRQLHELALLADVVAQCDLVALRPTDERTLRGACCDSDFVDLVALDLTQRLPFAFKFSTLSVALARDIFFEIDVAPLLAPTADAHTRSNVLAQAVSLVRVTKGRNIVLTCSATGRADLRTAADIINVARVIGLTEDQAHASMTHAAARCVRRGHFRATTRSFGVMEIRERTPADDAAFGVDDDDFEDDDDDDDKGNDDDDDTGLAQGQFIL
jgi:RNase P/RNase MRP subunit p30